MFGVLILGTRYLNKCMLFMKRLSFITHIARRDWIRLYTYKWTRFSSRSYCVPRLGRRQTWPINIVIDLKVPWVKSYRYLLYPIIINYTLPHNLSSSTRHPSHKLYFRAHTHWHPVPKRGHWRNCYTTNLKVDQRAIFLYLSLVLIYFIYFDEGVKPLRFCALLPVDSC